MAGPPTRSIRRRAGRRTSRSARRCARRSATTPSCSIRPGPTIIRRLCGSAARSRRWAFHWYEDPLADQDIYNYVKLKQQLSIPILATEYPITGLDGYQPWIMLQATDFLRGDVAVKGGITTLVKGAHLAEVVSHELRSPSWRQFAEQCRQSARHRLDPQYRVLRGAAARRARRNTAWNRTSWSAATGWFMFQMNQVWAPPSISS